MSLKNNMEILKKHILVKVYNKEGQYTGQSTMKRDRFEYGQVFAKTGIFFKSIAHESIVLPLMLYRTILAIFASTMGAPLPLTLSMFAIAFYPIVIEFVLLVVRIIIETISSILPYSKKHEVREMHEC